MTKLDLTHYQRRRLVQHEHRCSLCSQFITDNENIILIKEHVGRLVKYSFFHERCYNGKE